MFCLVNMYLYDLKNDLFMKKPKKIYTPFDLQLNLCVCKSVKPVLCNNRA